MDDLGILENNEKLDHVGIIVENEELLKEIGGLDIERKGGSSLGSRDQGRHNDTMKNMVTFEPLVHHNGSGLDEKISITNLLSRNNDHKGNYVRNQLKICKNNER